MSELHRTESLFAPRFAEVSKLPYPNAVMKKSIRVFSTPNYIPMERKEPAGSASIAGVYFSEGMTVVFMPSAVHFNPAAFGTDAEIFRPERWLDAEESSLRAMKMAYLGFNRGRKVCLGQNIVVVPM